MPDSKLKITAVELIKKSDTHCNRVSIMTAGMAVILAANLMIFMSPPFCRGRGEEVQLDGVPIVFA